MGQHLHVEHWIPVPLSKVFAFFADPHNLPRIMPPSQGAKILKLNLVAPKLPTGTGLVGLERMAGAGTEIHFKFRAIPYIPIHERWVAQITEFSFNEYFCDVQKQGPFKSWHHTHYFESETVEGIDGTLVGDDVEYAVGFGMVGTALENAVFQHMMRRIFEHRKIALERVFAAEIAKPHLVRK